MVLKRQALTCSLVHYSFHDLGPTISRTVIAVKEREGPGKQRGRGYLSVGGAMPDDLDRGLVGKAQQHDHKVVQRQPPEQCRRAKPLPVPAHSCMSYLGAPARVTAKPLSSEMA